MKAALAQNRLGAVAFFHCVHRNAVGPEYLTSELVIANSAVHEIDIARFLLEEEFAWVAVTSPRASMRAPGRRPQFIVLETRGGVVVDVEVFVDATYGYEVKGEMVCEAGAVMLARGPAITTREAGHEITVVEPDWRARFKTAYREQIAGWVELDRKRKAERIERLGRICRLGHGGRLPRSLAFPDPNQGDACRHSRLLQVTVTVARSRPPSCVCAGRGRRGRGSPMQASPRSMVRGWDRHRPTRARRR